MFSGNNVDYCVKYKLPKGETLTLTTANETNYGYVFPVWQDEQIVSLQFGEAVSIPTRKTKLLDNYAYEILKDDKKGKNTLYYLAGELDGQWGGMTIIKN